MIAKRKGRSEGRVNSLIGRAAPSGPGETMAAKDGVQEPKMEEDTPREKNSEVAGVDKAGWK